MKKISTILAFAIMSSTMVQAQRMIDLATTLNSPAAGTNITSGQSFQVEVAVKNVGTTPLNATDTILISFYIDNPNNLLRDNNNNPLLIVASGQALATNETITSPLNLTISTSTTGSHQFCAIAFPLNRSVDSVKDAVLGNNSGCNSVQFVTGPTSVKETTASLSKHLVSSAYPNPASGFINFDLKMGSREAVSIVVTDLAGRTVIKESKGMLSNGEHTININTRNLPTGIYVYEVRVGEETTRGKVSLHNNQ